MTEHRSAAARIAAALCTVLGVPELPVGLRAWDGTQAGPDDGPTLVVRSRRALRRLVWAPGELGVARAYIAGDLDVDGDLYGALAALTSGSRVSSGAPKRLSPARLPALLGAAARVGALGPPPPPPPEEYRPRRRGRLHSRERDAAAVTHHYDVGNDFYALVLGPTLVYSCAVWTDECTGLNAAQEAKLDLVCRKLALAPGTRLLDVGCGWGSLALHAARRYGADVVGITLSTEQAALARRRVIEAGLGERITIRVQDYRDVADGPYDAISSIGMAEHVGHAAMPQYVATQHRLLRPGGRLLNHAIAWAGEQTTWDADTFISRYVFPDGELLRLSETVAALEAGGFETLDVEGLRRHYALTLRAWVDRLEKHWDAAVALTSPGRARVWRLYMAASALSFEQGWLGLNQVLVQRPGGDPPPLRLREWI